MSINIGEVVRLMISPFLFWFSRFSHKRFKITLLSRRMGGINAPSQIFFCSKMDI